MLETIMEICILIIFTVLIYFLLKVSLINTSTKYIIVNFGNKTEVLDKPVLTEDEVLKILGDLQKLLSKDQSITITEWISNKYFGPISHSNIGKVEYNHIYWNYNGIKIDRSF